MSENNTEQNSESLSFYQKKLEELISKKKNLIMQKDELNKSLDSNFDKLNKNLEEKKVLASEINKIKVEKIDPINKEINEIRKDLPKKEDKQNVKDPNYMSPGRLKHEIEELEFSIETIPMSIKKERAVMDKIKSLKNQLNKMSDEREERKVVNTKYSELKEKFDIRNEASNLIKEIKTKLEKLDSDRDELKKLVKKDKDQKNAINKNLDELKIEFNSIENKLGDKLKNLSTKLNKPKPKRQNKAQHTIKKPQVNPEIAVKIKVIEEKIKNKEKLNTQDLIFYQTYSTQID